MAGLNEYTLTTDSHSGSNGILTKPSTATQLVGPNQTTIVSSSSNITVKFVLSGKTYTQYVVSPSGWLLLSGASPNLTDDFTISSTPWNKSGRVLLFPWWDNLKTFGGIHTWLDTVTVNSIPYRVQVVQWDVFTDKTQTAIADGFCGTANNYENIKFQILLFDKISRIEYRYSDLGVTGTLPTTTWGASCGIRLSGTSESDGDYRDFFGTTGTPAGSTAPFLSNLLTRGGGLAGSVAYQYPGNSSNSVGYSYNFVFKLTGASDAAYLIPQDHFLATKMFKVKIISDHNHVSLGHCADTEDREAERLKIRCP